MPDGTDGATADGQANIDDISRADAALVKQYGPDLIELAVATIEHGLTKGRPPHVAVDSFAEGLRVMRATFVTLERENQLRGCIGSVIATRPLVEDLVENAFRAAFRDPRFPPLAAEEREGLGVSLSVLSPMTEMAVDSEMTLRNALRPGTDGLLIEDDGRRAVFLPQVWEQLPDPGQFLMHLKDKAGLARDYWSDDLKAWRFVVQKAPA